MSSKERLMQVLVAPHVSEKGARVAEQGNQIVFRVARDATKPEIKAAVELMFEVKVDAVQVVNVAGKAKRFGGRPGRRSDWKKAYVKLAQGQTIDFAGAEKRSARTADGRLKDGSHQDQTDVAGPALRREGRPLAPAQGRAGARAHGREEAHGRP